MKKYKCSVCEWIYDPAIGDPDGGIAPGTALKIFPRIGYVLCAVWEKICLKS